MDDLSEELQTLFSDFWKGVESLPVEQQVDVWDFVKFVSDWQHGLAEVILEEQKQLKKDALRVKARQRALNRRASK